MCTPEPERTWCERQAPYGFVVTLQATHVQQAATSCHVPHCRVIAVKFEKV